MTTFSEWLANELNQRNMSPAQLARLSKKDPGMISRLLAGERSASPETLVQIAHALHLPPENVFKAAVGLSQSDDELTPKKRELMERLKTADDADAQIVIDMLEVAVRNRQRQVPNNISPKTTPR